MKLNRYFPLFLVILLAAGCYKDKGNYEYTTLNNITVTATQKAYSLIVGDPLTITPQVTQDNGTDADLEFEWSMHLSGNPIANNPVIVMGRKRDLDTTIGIDVTPGSYRLVYKVTDKRTGIFSFTHFTLTISNEVQGWLLLEEAGGKGDVSIVHSSGRVYHNYYSAANQGQTLPLPLKRIELMNYAVTGNQNIFMLSENSAVGVNYQTLRKLTAFNDWFFEPPAVVKPQMNAMTSTIYGHLINDGLLYAKITATSYASPRFGYPLAWPDVPLPDQMDYAIFPFSVGGSQYYQSIYYDNRHGRFANVSQLGTLPVLQQFAAPAGQVFNMNNVGMKMLFMGQSPASLYTAIMKDEQSGQPYLIQFSNNIQTNLSPSVRKTVMNAPDVLSFSAAATSLLSQQLYYAVGNKVYLYDIAANLTREIYSFPAGETVTTMKAITIAGELQVCMTTATSAGAGKFYQFKADGTGNFVNNTYTSVYESFGKVVDMIYKQ